MISLFSAAALLFAAASAQAPPYTAITGSGTSFLNHTALLAGLWGQDFLKANVPYIDIPDQNISNVYYYRLSVVPRHLKYTVPGTGFMLTEFVYPPGYAQAFGSIDAAAGHQLQEAQWMRSTFYNEDYIQLYTRGTGDSTQYSHWILYAAATTANITGNFGFLASQLQGMIAMFDAWNYTYNPQVGLYYYTPNWDAQEYSLPGFVYTGGVNNQTELDGPNTYRPSVNAYMVANARAVASAAQLLGQTSVVSEFTQRANAIEQAMYQHLWDPSSQFFKDVLDPNNPTLQPLTGREEVGFYPFRFGVGLNSTYTKPTMAQLFNSSTFLTPYGPPTLEQINQYYSSTKPTSYCCYWQGQSWPFSTAHTISALADAYRTGTSGITAQQYYQSLRTYALTQYKNGVPYVAESHYPVSNSWSQDSYNHSENYLHSTTVNNVITELIGFIPRADNVIQVSPIIPSNWTYFALENVAYHGHLITILYDQTGKRYNQGIGLSIYEDGTKIYNGTGPSGTTTISNNAAAYPSPSSSAPSPLAWNVAVNPIGPSAWPKASATYTYSEDWVYQAIDGLLWYDDIPDNRWTNYQSPNNNDTVTIQLQRAQNLTGVVLAVYVDAYGRTPTGSISCPSAIQVTDGAGNMLANISNFASQCVANAQNTITFSKPSLTDTININFFRQGSYYVGVTEIQLWVPPNIGPVFYAADAYPQPGAPTGLVFDPLSKITSSGAVMSVSAFSVVDFSGIYSPNGSTVTMSLQYKNNGTAAVPIDWELNQIKVGQLQLQPGSGYQSINMQSVQLQKGTNFVSFSGGAASVFLESLTV